MSLCRAHREKIEAGLNQSDDLRDNLDAYELMLVQLHDDVLRIKNVKSTEGKNAVKAEIFPNYQAWIDGVIDTFKGGHTAHSRQDDVFAQCFVWAVDLLNLPLVETMLSVMLSGSMQLPERFKRAPADFAVEEIADAVIVAQQALPLEQMHRIEDLTAERDLHDEVRAKWLKAMGTLYESFDELEPLKLAAGYFDRALALDSKVGVKQRLDKLKKAIKKLTESSA